MGKKGSDRRTGRGIPARKINAFLSALRGVLIAHSRGELEVGAIDELMGRFRDLELRGLAFLLLPLGDLRRVDLRPGLFNVARLWVNGLTESEIAEVRRLTPSSVRTYVKRVYQKVGVHSRAELTLYFVLHHPEVFLPRMQRP